MLKSISSMSDFNSQSPQLASGSCLGFDVEMMDLTITCKSDTLGINGTLVSVFVLFLL